MTNTFSLEAHEELAQMHAVIVDALDTDHPNAKAIRDAMYFSRDMIESRHGVGDMSESDARVTVIGIANDYMHSNAWDSVTFIADKVGWRQLLERAADYAVGHIENIMLQEAIRDALWTEPNAIQDARKNEPGVLN